MRISVARVVVPRIDWWRVVMDLQARNYSKDHIHHAIGRSPSWVQTLKNLGVEPRHRDGQALLQLWSSVTDRPVESAPKMDL